MSKSGIYYVVAFLLVAVFVASYYLYSSPSRGNGRIGNVDIANGGLSTNSKSATMEKDSADSRSGINYRLWVSGARLAMESLPNQDNLRVIAQASGANGSAVTFSYEWTKNGQPAGNGDSISGFKRGDKLSVKITPFDGRMYGEPKTVSTEVLNSPPKIIENKTIEITASNVTYKVMASDSDGDTLKYSLLEAPNGMTIDDSGIIRWAYSKDDYGTHTVKYKISDGHGGEVVSGFTFEAGNN